MFIVLQFLSTGRGITDEVWTLLCGDVSAASSRDRRRGDPDVCSYDRHAIRLFAT